MKTNYILLVLTATLFTACNDDSDDDNNDNNPPANQDPSFSGTVTDVVNGPSSEFSADVIEVLHDTLTDRLYVNLEDNDGTLISFTIASAEVSAYTFSPISDNEAYLSQCTSVSEMVNTKPNDDDLSAETAGTVTVDSYNEEDGKLSLTISSLTFYEVNSGVDDDVASISLTAANLVNADVTKTAVGLNYLDEPDIDCLVNGNLFDSFLVSAGSEFNETISAFGILGQIAVVIPFDPVAGEYVLTANPTDEYRLAYNTNDQASFQASSGTLVLTETCDGYFHGTFEGEVEIATGSRTITQGRFAFVVD
jgi:hypothetical protein